MGIRESIFLFPRTNEFCGKPEAALEARVAWDGLGGGRRVAEEAGRGSGSWCRVGKIEMVVNGRGVPGGPLRVRALGALERGGSGLV